ncbi:hypothetical protein BY996DRAFT_6967716 [Phakopsora pachyrhizi]|nr:hypothetical protein BY996DRAFT_6967716 [Phakopsora pachyrhizi]
MKLNEPGAWTNLPGWVNFHLRKKTELKSTFTTNAEVYDELCKLWNLPDSFGLEISNRDVYVFTTSDTINSLPRTSSRHDQLFHSTTRDLVQVLNFLVDNGGGTFKRIIWSSQSSLRVLDSISSTDWVIFPSTLFWNWISNESVKDFNLTERLTTFRRKFSHRSSRPRVATFGGSRGIENNFLVARSIGFSEIWNHGFFITFSSKAASSSPEDLKKLMSTLDSRSYDYLISTEPPSYLELWTSLQTHLNLNPLSGRTSRPKVSTIRAFNFLNYHNLSTPPIVYLSQLEDSLGQASERFNTNEVLKKNQISMTEAMELGKTMKKLFRDEEIDFEEDELGSIFEVSTRLVNQFWRFRLCIVILSDDELRKLPNRFDLVPQVESSSICFCVANPLSGLFFNPVL